MFWEKLGLTFKRECSGLCQQGLVLVIQPQSVGTNPQSYTLHHALQVLSRLTFPCHLQWKVLLGPDKVIIWIPWKYFYCRIKEVTVKAALQRLELDVLSWNMTTSWSRCVPFLGRGPANCLTYLTIGLIQSQITSEPTNKYYLSQQLNFKLQFQRRNLHQRPDGDS